jgi:hypothetical protein
MLYTCSGSASRKVGRNVKRYYILRGRGNDDVVPDKHDLDLHKNGALTAKGFALNYETKLRKQEAYKWMERVSAIAAHEDIVLVGNENGGEKSYITILAEMMTSMFGGKMNFRYLGKLE